MEYFTADWHLSHRAIIEYCERPFDNINDMDATIYYKAINKLKKGDLLYFLGDLSFNKTKVIDFFSLMENIGIQVHFIFGNHDNGSKNIIKDRAVWSGDLKVIKIQNQDIVLSHYSMRVWHKSHFNSWNLFGHSHGGLEPIGKSWDVGVDNNNFYIYSFDEIKTIMDSRPDNFNYIGGGGGE